MADDFGEDEEDKTTLSGLVIGPEDIQKKYLNYKKALDGIIDISNLENMSKMLTYMNKDALYTIRKLLNGIKTCYTEFRLSRSEKYASQIDHEHIQKALKEVQNRINFTNLKSTPIDLMSIVSNKEVCEILYEFFKIKVSIMDLSKLSDAMKDFTKGKSYKDFQDTILNIQKEIKRNKNHNQAEMVKLDELLREIFEKLDIEDLDNISEELQEILNRMRKINEENEKLAKRYDGSYSFVKTYIDAVEVHPEYDKEDIARVLDTVYLAVKDIKDANILILQGRDIFCGSVKKTTIATLLKNGLYKNLNLKDWYTDLLGEVYTNMKLF